MKSAAQQELGSAGESFPLALATERQPATEGILSERDPQTLALYARGAHVYDRLNHILSGGTGNWYRRQALASLHLPQDASVIDLGCGTGTVALAAQELLPKASSIVAVDPSPAMREIAASAGAADVRDGCFKAIPAEDRSCTALVSAYALRYANPRLESFAEILRVLKPGGNLLLLEMIVAPGGWRRTFTESLLTQAVAPIASLLCRDRAAGELIEHLWDSVSGLDGPESILSDLESAGFCAVEYRHAGGLLGEFRACAPEA